MSEKFKSGLGEKSVQGKNFFSKILISKIGVKMKLRIMIKNYAVDSVIQFPTKSILRPIVLKLRNNPLPWELRFLRRIVSSRTSYRGCSAPVAYPSSMPSYG